MGAKCLLVIVAILAWSDYIDPHGIKGNPDQHQEFGCDGDECVDTILDHKDSDAVTNERTKRSITCEDAGGKCMPAKKQEKCKKSINRKYACSGKNKVCCIEAYTTVTPTTTTSKPTDEIVNQCLKNGTDNSVILQTLKYVDHDINSNLNDTNKSIKSCIHNAKDDIEIKLQSMTQLQDEIEIKLQGMESMLINITNVLEYLVTRLPVPTTSTQTEVPTEAPTTEVPTEATTTEVPTEVPTEAPTTEVPTEVSTTEVPTEATTTEVPTEAPTTEVPTEAPTTEVPTEAPTTEVPTEAPTTEEPTEAPTTEEPTEAPTTETITVAPTKPRTTTPAETLASRCNNVNGFLTPSQDECFVFNQEWRSWDAVVSYCSSLGLQMAAPRDGNAIWLRKHIIDNYGDRYWTHLSGRGDGSAIVMNGEAIPESNTLWWPGQPGSSVPTSHCLILMTNNHHMNQQPDKPYYSQWCSYAARTLCELV